MTRSTILFPNCINFFLKSAIAAQTRYPHLGFYKRHAATLEACTERLKIEVSVFRSCWTTQTPPKLPLSGVY
ncbi:hypothetical protein L1987_53066 [Smallanthus sonchifolius]|uniref:Uncharacterized protein n=1 Tax=Smallanthus sonchifolius TaxID=185202 RepID=A0ACB9EUJ5_9ASTR|nr:hypothetical protein L1987_53066 [Smallanthus sonchifolius]